MAAVLIIESDNAVATSLSEALSDRGVESRLIADGAEGLKIARDEQPDVIVLCVELSRVSGYSICNKLKKSPALAKIPLILTSDKATEETFEQHKKLKTRAEQYLKKPYAIDQMLGLIAQYIDLDDSDIGGEVQLEELDVDLVGDEDEFDVAFADETDAGLTPFDDGSDPDVDDNGFGGDFAATQVMTLPADFIEKAQAAQAAEEAAEAKAEAAAAAAAAAEAVAIAGTASAEGLEEIALDPDLTEPEPAKKPRRRPSSERPESTGATNIQVERMREEIKDLRAKVKTLEQTLEEKESEFTDRLLQESGRSREGIELKKKLGQMEREVGKLKEATEKAEEKAKESETQILTMQAEMTGAADEKEILADKIRLLAEKVKSLAAERDELRAALEELREKQSGIEEQVAQAEELKAKAKKAVDIAVQLLDDTGLLQ